MMGDEEKQGLWDKAKDLAGEAVDKVQDVAEEAIETAETVADTAIEKAGEAKDAVVSTASATLDKVGETICEAKVSAVRGGASLRRWCSARAELRFAFFPHPP